MPRLSRHIHDFVQTSDSRPFAGHSLASAATSSMDRLRMLAAHLNADPCAGEYLLPRPASLAVDPRRVSLLHNWMCCARRRTLIGVCRCWRGDAANTSNR